MLKVKKRDCLQSFKGAVVLSACNKTMNFFDLGGVGILKENLHVRSDNETGYIPCGMPKNIHLKLAT